MPNNYKTAYFRLKKTYLMTVLWDLSLCVSECLALTAATCVAACQTRDSQGKIRLFDILIYTWPRIFN